MRLACGLGLWLASGGALAARVFNGPWVTDVGPDRAVVRFELDLAAPAAVVVGDRRFESPQAAFHRVALSDLPTDARVRYRIEVGPDRGPEGSFALDRPGERARYLVYGDVRSDHQAHAAVVRAMLRERPDLVVHTGDFVADGANLEDWRIFFDVERRLLRRACLAPTMGNHEAYREGGADQYRRYLGLGGARPGAGEDAVFRFGDTAFLLVSSNNDGFPAAQRRWLERALARLDDDTAIRHRVAVLHDGPFSSGRHGGNAEMLRDGFADFLKDVGVRVVFSGHDHDYERGRADGIPYVVTGGGGAPLYTVNSRQPYQQRFEATYHYVRVESLGDDLRVVAVRPDGTAIEECTLGGGDWSCGARSRSRPPARQGSIGWLELAAAGGAAATAVLVGARFLRRKRA